MSKYKMFIPKIAAVLFAGAVLYLMSLYNYLLFHSTAELFSIIIAFTLFIIAWNSKNYLEQYFGYLIYIGIAYIFVSFLDLLHTLSYAGMQIFKDYDYYANQLWVGARYLESLSLLIPFIFLRFKRRLKPYLTAVIYTIVTSAIIASIFYFKIFPVCFVDGQGQTEFKIISEYVICFILLIDALLLRRYKSRFDEKVYKYLFWSVIATIVSELEFVQYISNYGFANLAGHFFKIISFYLIYKAVIKTCITQPYESIFKELMDEKEKLTKLTMTDELTGLYNRRAAFDLLGKMMKIVSRSGESVTICYIDVDNLKLVNDKHGHIQGDIMLVTVSKMLTCYVRESDYICRIGGDEFLIILPNTSVDQAEYMIRRVRENMDKYNSESSETYKVDFSYGFAEYNELNRVTIDALMETADNNMYRNKMEKKKDKEIL